VLSDLEKESDDMTTALNNIKKLLADIASQAGTCQLDSSNADVKKLESDFEEALNNLINLPKTKSGIYKNLMKNVLDIGNVVNNIKDAKSKNDSLEVGKGFGVLIRLVLLDVESLSEEPLEWSPADLSKVMIGLADGLEQKDMSADLAKCAPAEMKVMTALNKVVQDVMLKTEEGLEQALKDLPAVLEAYKATVEPCAEYNADVQQLQADLTTVIQNVSQLATKKDAFLLNVATNEEALKTDVAALVQAYKSQDALALSKSLGDMLRLTLLHLDNQE